MTEELRRLGPPSTTGRPDASAEGRPDHRVPQPTKRTGRRRPEPLAHHETCPLEHHPLSQC